MPSSLSTATLRTVERLWEERMSAPKGTLSRSGVSMVEWPGFDAAVNLEVGDSLLVAGPEEAIARLRQLPRRQLADPEVAESALRDLRPRRIGSAFLAYADASTFTPSPATHEVHQAELDAAERTVAHCDAEDRDESGLLEMSTWFVADENGVPVAAAGYEEWPQRVAHCGVAVDTGHRGRGLGRSVASAAVGHALQEHAAVQWRSRDSNAASTRLGARLGFVQVGRQTSFELCV